MRLTYIRHARGHIEAACFTLGRRDKALYDPADPSGPEVYAANRALKFRAVEVAKAHPAVRCVEVYAPAEYGGFTVAAWDRSELVDA